MKLRSIETTPSPNCMKLNLDAPVSAKAITLNQTRDKAADSDSPATPAFAQEFMAIAGVKSVFIMGDFITLTRRGNVDWQPILTAAGNLIGLSDAADPTLAQSITAPEPSKDPKTAAPA